MLECHAFVCKRETAANALVRCCFHAYADNEYVKQMDESPYAQINGRPGETPGGKDQLDSAGNWENADVTDSDNNTASSTQPGHSKLLNGSVSANAKPKLLNGKSNGTKSNGGGFVGELNSDDTEIMTTNSSISQNSPEEDEDVALINSSSYKIWPTSKSLSGSVKNLNLNSKEAAMVAKGASMRSLRPRQMVMPNMLPPPMPFIPIHAIPPHAMPHPAFYPLIDKPPKSKLLKKMKSKSMITLVPQNAPIPSHAIPIGQAPPFLQQSFNGKHQQMMLINHPPYGPPPQMLPPMIPIAGTPQPITGNLHSIKKKSKKSKEEKKMLQQQLNEMQFIGQHPGQHMGQHLGHHLGQPVYIPPMRPLTPLANYLGNQSPINQKYLIHTVGPHAGLGSIYHTAPRNRKESKKLSKKEKDKLSAIDADELQAMINNQNLANYHNQQAQQSANNRSNSPFNTGIYRKGHLNERAFSYSIRQEHRSRSNSVANLNFNADELDHPHEPQDIQHLLNGQPPSRKLMQNGGGGAVLNNSGSQGSPSSISKQQLVRQQQQYLLHQQQLSDALSSLQLNAQPKTASIKRSKLNNNSLLFHNNGQLNGTAGKQRNGYDGGLSNLMAGGMPVNGKLVLPHRHQNGNAPFDQRPESMKKKVK